MTGMKETSVMSKKSIIVFVSLLLLVSWAVQGLAIYVVGDLNSVRATPWLISLMFFPTIAALIYRFGFNRDAFRHVHAWPGNPIYLFLAALVPAATSLVVLAIVEFAGWGHCEFFAFSSHSVQLLKGPWVLGSGVQSWWMFAANIAATAIVFSLINSVVAVGEEFCWRGFLQGHMIEKFGTIGAITLLGLIWAYWHLPSNLAGYNYTQTPVLGGLVLFPVQLVAESLVMAWLTIRARSFWPAVVMHGSGNGIGEGILSHITLAEHVSQLRVDMTSIIVALVLGIACAWVLVRRRAGRNEPTHIGA